MGMGRGGDLRALDGVLVDPFLGAGTGGSRRNCTYVRTNR
jgi:hypothetical protein